MNIITLLPSLNRWSNCSWHRHHNQCSTPNSTWTAVVRVLLLLYTVWLYLTGSAVWLQPHVETAGSKEVGCEFWSNWSPPCWSPVTKALKTTLAKWWWIIVGIFLLLNSDSQQQQRFIAGDDLLMRINVDVNVKSIISKLPFCSDVSLLTSSNAGTA